VYIYIFKGEFVGDFMDKFSLKNPTIIFCAGPNAAGKTTFSRKLGKSLTDSLILDKDTLAQGMLMIRAEDPKYLHELDGSYPMNSDFYGTHVKAQSNGLLFTLARDSLDIGKIPIIDAPNIREMQARYFEDVVEPTFNDVDIRIVYCYAPQEVIRERMTQRDEERDASKLESDASWDAFLEDQPIIPSELEKYDHFKLDTSQGTDELHLKSVREYLLRE
jgi:predicted kinase